MCACVCVSIVPQEAWNNLTYDPAFEHIPKELYIILERHLLIYVHFCSIYTSQKLETV